MGDDIDRRHMMRIIHSCKQRASIMNTAAAGMGVFRCYASYIIICGALAYSYLIYICGKRNNGVRDMFMLGDALVSLVIDAASGDKLTRGRRQWLHALLHAPHLLHAHS